MCEIHVRHFQGSRQDFVYRLTCATRSVCYQYTLSRSLGRYGPAYTQVPGEVGNDARARAKRPNKNADGENATIHANRKSTIIKLESKAHYPS